MNANAMQQLDAGILDRLGLDKFSVWGAHPKSALGRKALAKYRSDPEGKAHLAELAQSSHGEQKDFAGWYSHVNKWADRLGVTIPTQPTWAEVCRESLAGARCRIGSAVQSALLESAAEQIGDNGTVSISMDQCLFTPGADVYVAQWDGFDVIWQLDAEKSAAMAVRKREYRRAQEIAPDTGGAGYGMNAVNGE